MSRIISLDAIGRTASARTRPRAGTACTSAGGGCPSGGGDAIPPAVLDRIREHPCYSEDAHHFFARMHIAVAPACNIQCNYCNRKYDCANESRPGVTSTVLSEEAAEAKVRGVAARLPQLSVVGIAGPGDALADAARSFRAFERIAAAVPGLKLCLATNGLALPENVARIKALGIDHVTITINAVDPEIGSRIHPWVAFGGRRLTGVEGAAVLIRQQLEGLERLVAADVLVKVNSVMIPGINDGHLPAVNAAIKARGAFLHNIMPLISDPAHGTRFGLDGQRGPTPQELKAMQDSLAGGARLMRHCRQCRADAVGMLGDDADCGPQTDAVAAEDATIRPDAEQRARYREVVAQELADRDAASAAVAGALERIAAPVSMLVAVCTKGGGRINRHFGHASEFQLFEVDRAGVRLVGHRRAGRYCQGGFGEEDVLDQVIAALDGVDAVLCAKIGSCPKDRLAEAGIAASDDYAFQYIEPAVAAFFRDAVGANDRAATA
ncbi:MAG: nitrogenase cofactor biosynthesis protein NifB [Rhodospirillales bacterium]|nr:MAG: nitrogenase cofactor biosynthesis protein NifB [Rhodospirillales bacterium]